MDQVKWLLVGAGDKSKKRVAPALAGTDKSEIAAVCDRNCESAKALANEFKIAEVFTDFPEALSKSKADAVYLAVPVCLHIPMALEALKAGKHVLIEKPLGLTAEECRPLLEMAEKIGKKAGCAYFRRFSPGYVYTKKMLDSGEFGQVVLIRMVYFSWFAPAANDGKYWRVVRAKSGGGALADMGTHMFDVLIGLFGLPISVCAKCDNLVHKWDVEDSAVILMTMRDGAQVTASFNWNSQTWRHEFEVIGTKAKINWLPYDSGQVIKTVGRQIDNLDMPSVANVHQPLVDDFVRAVLDDRPPCASIAEAFKTSLLLDAIYRSAAENREIMLENM